MPADASAAEPRRSRDPLWASLVDLVAARECGGCDGSASRRSPLCLRCLEAIARERPRRVATAVAGVPRTFAVAHYEDPVRTMLIAYKERGRSDLRPVLGRALACALAEVLAGVPAPASGRAPAGGPALLVPVPSTRSSVRRRGADTTADLARAAARVLREEAGLDVRAVPALRHVRRVADQAGLVYAERAANLAGALAVRRRGSRRLAPAASPPDAASEPAARSGPRYGGPPVLLVDDIATSGASLAEAARALRSQGVTVAGAGVVAAARFRR